MALVKVIPVLPASDDFFAVKYENRLRPLIMQAQVWDISLCSLGKNYLTEVHSLGKREGSLRDHPPDWSSSGTPDSPTPLTALLTHGDLKRREFAAYAMGAMGDRRFLEPLKRAFTEALALKGSRAEDLQVAIIEAIGSIGADGASIFSCRLSEGPPRTGRSGRSRDGCSRPLGPLHSRAVRLVCSRVADAVLEGKAMREGVGTEFAVEKPAEAKAEETLSQTLTFSPDDEGPEEKA
jgi:hypothetical protein